MHEIITIQNLACGYQEENIISGIDIILRKGDFAGIIGPNGSGKSTLFKVLGSELVARTGYVLLNNRKLEDYTLREKARQIAIVTQFPVLSVMSVEEYVLMGRLPYRKAFCFFNTKEDLEIVHDCMRMTGIFHLRSHLVTELSGGEQQMAGIACALAQKPKILLLDEATSHLDITHQTRIMNLLQKLNEEENLTILMIIHDLNMAAEYCHHLIMMQKGAVYKQGTPAEVLLSEHIEAVYETVVIVQNNPASGNPLIFPVSDKYLSK